MPYINWAEIPYLAVSALLVIMIHEVCHGVMAYFLGDPTAKMSGRLTFNPIRHIDPFGLLMLIVFKFGWAKPVPVNTRYFRHQKSGMALVALAGPMSNFLTAIVAMLLLYSLLILGWLDGTLGSIIYKLLVYIIQLAIGLGVFNLLPIPPLDGFKVLGALIPERHYFFLLQYERYGMIVLIMLLYLNVLDAPLGYMFDRMFNFCDIVAGFPFRLFGAM